MKEFMHKVFVNNVIFSRWLAFLLVSVCAYVFSERVIVAQTTDSLDRLFTIRSIAVDVTARNASDARRTAIAQAEEQAYAKLLLKLTQPEGRSKLPEISELQRQTMISGIEVVEEQSSSKRYIAKLDVRFEPSSVSSFFAEYNVPHVLGTGRGLIVLHGHSDGFTNYIWQPKNTSLEARLAVDWLNRIRNYVFPRGELRERAAISFREVAAFNVGNVKDIAQFYDVESALLIRSEWSGSGDGAGVLTYGFFSTDGNWQKGGVITAQGDKAEMEAQRQMFEIILEEIDSAWRDQLLVDTGTQGELATIVPTPQLSNLVTIEKRLKGVSLVQGVIIKSVGLPFSEITFKYTGREEQLKTALRYAGLELSMYGAQHMLSIKND